MPTEGSKNDLLPKMVKRLREALAKIDSPHANDDPTLLRDVARPSGREAALLSGRVADLYDRLPDEHLVDREEAAIALDLHPSQVAKLRKEFPDIKLEHSEVTRPPKSKGTRPTKKYRLADVRAWRAKVSAAQEHAKAKREEDRDSFAGQSSDGSSASDSSRKRGELRLVGLEDAFEKDLLIVVNVRLGKVVSSFNPRAVSMFLEDGHRIERTSLHAALAERVWVDVEERALWQEAYDTLLSRNEVGMGDARDRQAEEDRESLRHSLDIGLPVPERSPDVVECGQCGRYHLPGVRCRI